MFFLTCHTNIKIRQVLLHKIRFFLSYKQNQSSLCLILEQAFSIFGLMDSLSSNKSAINVSSELTRFCIYSAKSAIIQYISPQAGLLYRRKLYTLSLISKKILTKKKDDYIE